MSDKCSIFDQVPSRVKLFRAFIGLSVFLTFFIVKALNRIFKGVEILKNEPYDNGPGGSGQYTEKLYHVQSHLPQWVSAFLSKGI